MSVCGHLKGHLLPQADIRLSALEKLAKGLGVSLAELLTF